MLDALFGVSKLKSGRILRGGELIRIKNEKDAIQKGFSLVTEDRKKYGLLFQTDIKRNMTINTLDKISTFGFVSSGREKARAEKFFNQMRVKARGVDTRVFTLSGGNQQKVVIGRALNAEPEILLFDEPTKGIDVGSKNDIYVLINELAARGKSIIMVSSELPELIEMCDRFVVLAEGTVVDEFDRAEASDTRVIAAATKSKSRAAQK